MNNEFKTAEELYQRIKPALYSKYVELNKLGIDYVQMNDIWNYLINNKWESAKNLSISQMVSDIFTLSNEEIKEYVISLIRKKDVKADIEDGDVL